MSETAKTPQTNDPLKIEAPVTEVTLLEDRARVVRQGCCLLPAGNVKVTVENIAPVIVDKTLGASIANGGEGCKVHDVRVVRRARILRGDRPEDVRALETRIEEEARERHRLATSVERTSSDLETLGKINRQTLNEISEEVAWDRVAPDDWGKRLEKLSEREQTLRERVLELGEKLKEKDELLADLTLQRDRKQSPSTTNGADLIVELQLPEEREYEMRFEYLVPGACWRPYHTAELSYDGKTVQFRSDGCVWQNTGEDWEDVQLFFSTQRPSLGTEPPKLDSDQLMVRKKPTTMEVEAREQEIHTTGMGAEKKEAKDELPGIDDAGEVRHMKAEARAGVPSDGRPYRVPMFRFEAAALTELVLMAELAPEVILKSAQSNNAEHPILAGPVDLIRDCGLVGRTSVLFIAPGETFPLGWGPDGALRVTRERTAREDKKGILSSWVPKEYNITVHVSNIGDAAKRVEVTERVPISEVEKVEIKTDTKHTSGGQLPDDNGFVKWSMDLRPMARESVRLRYTMKRHQDVVGV